MKIFFFLSCSVVMLLSCKAFMHGYTWDRSANKYIPVANNHDDFGYKRLQYTKAMHRQSALANFLDCICKRDMLPDAIYEYRTPAKQYGIRLYYRSIDSVYVYEEPRKNRPVSNLKEMRTISPEEKEILLATLRR